MKNITRALALLLALILVLGLVVTGFAEDGGTTAAFNGTITVSNTVDGQDYTLYRILDLESYNETAKAYSYKPAEGWDSFFKGTDISGTYVDINELGYVTWKKSADGNDVAGVETFAKLAQTYAVNNADAVARTKSTQNATGNTVAFNNLSLGYYLLDSSLGTLCSLDTTNTKIDIHEKNVVPSNDKQVQEDSKENEAGKGWGKTNDADFGQVVKFKSTITLPKGASNVKYHDTMDANLELDKTSIGVYTSTEPSTKLSETNYSVISDASASALTDNCTFEITFNQEYLNGLTAYTTTVYVCYSAKVKNTATVGTALVNKSHLTYGDKNTESAESTTKTYTWGFDVLKYANGQEASTLSSVKFILLNQGKNKVATFNGNSFVDWAEFKDKATDPNYMLPNNATLTTGNDGKIILNGLDSDTYYLRETEGLPGYNKLANDVEVQVEATVTENATSMSYTRKIIKVENKSGTEMPSTGGIGTTVFYVVGGILAVGAAVLLVTKKRMERG